MMYCSTRNKRIKVTSAQAISRGISSDGGLFVPESIPSVINKMQEFLSLDYNNLAVEILKLYLTDFSEKEIELCVSAAYNAENFDGNEPVKLVTLSRRRHILELWHGPTCAFKDMALQLLPYLLTCASKKEGDDKTAVILTATSGDTGKAALEGFADVEGTKIFVFYPEKGVSPMQKRQMAVQKGENVKVFAIRGNFDDTQAGVKSIFIDETVKAALDEHKMKFSSANSINWGRLLPQIIYYFYAYFELCRKGEIAFMKDKVNISVPTGNFGNILAAYYAREMGLPVGKLICASNANNVLFDFFNTGRYDKNRKLVVTASPSMDILVSSNLERLLFHLTNGNSEKLSEWMEALADNGRYDVGDDNIKKAADIFFAGFCDDDETKDTIKSAFSDDGYLPDTHTAVALNVYERYVEETRDDTAAIIVSTASPYKFSRDVIFSLTDSHSDDEFEIINDLERISGVMAPQQLKKLKKEELRFNTVIEKSHMTEAILYALGL